MGASRLVSAGRGNTSGSGRYPSAFRGPPLDAARRSTWEPRGWFLLAGAALQALDGTRARFGTSGSGRYPSAFRAPLLMLPGAALGSLAARFCWQGHTHTRHTHVDSLTHTRQTHTRSLTVPFAHGARAGASLTHSRRTHVRSRCPSAFHTRHTLGSLAAGAALQALDGARARFGAPRLDAARRSTWEPRGSFLLAGAALQALDGTQARFGPPPLDAARRSTWQPRGSFLLAGAALQPLDGTRARFGAPLLMLPGAALGSLAAGFCWGQHFRLWTVPERVSGPPPLMLPGAALGSLGARFCWQGHTHTRHTHVESLTHTRQTHTRSLTVPFFYTHTRHTHVDSLTHTRQTHTRSLTVPFAHGARAGASLDTHTVDAHTFAHGARAGRCPSAFRGPPP